MQAPTSFDLSLLIPRCLTSRRAGGFYSGFTCRLSTALNCGLRHGLLLFAALLATACSDSDYDNDSPVPEKPSSEVVELPVSLTGTNEVPSVDTAATGMGLLTFTADDSVLEGSVTVMGMEGTSAHIHGAFAGANGDIIIPLEEVSGSPGVWQVPAGTMLNAEQTETLLSGGMYVNVHSEAYPAGEIRGQLLPADIGVLWLDLNGEEEIPAVDTGAEGRAAVTVDTADRSVVVNARTTGLTDASAAHIHHGFAGMNGEVVVPLMQSADSVDHWMLTATELTEAQYEALLAGQMYINVHTPANPGGELRGQILPANLSVHWASLSGANEVPPVTTDASGRAAVTLDAAGMEIVLRATTTGVDDATAAHIHQGAAGVNGPVIFPLSQSAVNLGIWTLPPTELTQEQYDALLAGELYVNVHTPAYPGGEIRGQIMP